MRCYRLVAIQCAVVVLFGSAAAMAQPNSAGQQPPPVIFEEIAPPPPTLAGFAAVADAVALVKISDNCRGVEYFANPGPIPSHFLKCQSIVMDVLKDNENLSPKTASLSVLRSGSERVENGRAVRTKNPDFPDFVAGQDYILFLHWNSTLGQFLIMHGYEGALQIVNGSVIATGVSPFARSQNGRRVSAVVADLKSAARAPR